MGNDAVAAEGMVLLIDIPHDLPVGDRVVSVLHVAAIALVEAIPEQCDHRKPDGFLVVVPFLQLLELSVVLPGDHALREHAELLNPVLLDDLPYSLPVHRHSLFFIYTSNQEPPLL